jgi:hypothetical protein
MISTLYFWPMSRKSAIADSRETSSRTTGRFSRAIFRISSSMRTRSSGVNPSGRFTS